jgi:hypothetical protein
VSDSNVLPFPTDPTADDPDTPVVDFQGYYKGFLAPPSGDGEVTLKIGVPNDQADEAWRVRQLVGLTLRFQVSVPPVPDDDPELWLDDEEVSP